jgi:hypothetical protein
LVQPDSDCRVTVVKIIESDLTSRGPRR